MKLCPGSANFAYGDVNAGNIIFILESGRRYYPADLK